MAEYSELGDWERLIRSWKQVRKNDGAAGVDGLTVALFESAWVQRLDEIRSRLLAFRYEPLPLLRFYVPKKDGSDRALCIPALADRIVLTSTADTLTPVLDASFSEASFAYRPGRSTKNALERAEALRSEGCHWAIHLDIEDFFDTIDHELLVSRLTKSVADYALLELLCAFLCAPVRDRGVETRVFQGVPQGSPLSPLLANLYLDAVDRALEAQGIPLVRYADNYWIFGKTCEDAERAAHACESLLAESRLRLNPEKTRRIALDEGTRFLGLTMSPVDARERQVAGGSKQAPASRVEDRDLNADQRPLSDECSDEETGAPAFRTLYIHEQGSVLNRSGERLMVRHEEKTLADVPIFKLKLVIVFGNCTVTAGAYRLCLEEGVPLVFLSGGGRYYGRLVSDSAFRFETQRAQFRLLDDGERRLSVARLIVKSKLHNGRALLARQRRATGKTNPAVTDAEDRLHAALTRADQTNDLDELRGVEGAATRAYFDGYRTFFRSELAFEGRQQRPANDPVNALLNLGYTLIHHNLVSFLWAEGINPNLGSLHQPRDGHPALASDLIEEMRAPIVDGLILYLTNTETLTREHFQQTPDGCRLTKDALKTFLNHFETKMNASVTHAASGVRGTWRTTLHGQVREYKRWLLGDGPAYRPIRIR